jgi:hypothetical protein
MRILILLFALLATPTFAQGWERYDNGRYGYQIDIPPGFVGQGESDNGDGQEFVLPGKAANLLVWGGMLMEPDFESEVDAAMGYAEEAAWNITGQTVTSRWAEISAIKGFRVFKQRLIALCDGTSYAALRLEYSVADSSEIDAVLGQMEKSFRAGCE